MDLSRGMKASLLHITLIVFLLVEICLPLKHTAFRRWVVHDSLMTHCDDEENSVVGGFDPKYHEMTDFYHKLCDSRYLDESCRAKSEARNRMRSRLNRRR